MKLSISSGTLFRLQMLYRLDQVAFLIEVQRILLCISTKDLGLELIVLQQYVCTILLYNFYGNL